MEGQDIAFWAVEFSISDFSKYTKINSNLIPLSTIHSTLLYITSKNKNHSHIFEKLEAIKCKTTISGYCYSNDAIVMKVSNITYINDKNVHTIVPFFPPTKKQHITLALSEGTRAKDSIRCFSNGTKIEFKTPLIVFGYIKRYMKNKSPENKEEEEIWFYDQKDRPYGVFSNFYPCKITINNATYYHSEGYF